MVGIEQEVLCFVMASRLEQVADPTPQQIIAQGLGRIGSERKFRHRCNTRGHRLAHLFRSAHVIAQALVEKGEARLAFGIGSGGEHGSSRCQALFDQGGRAVGREQLAVNQHRLDFSHAQGFMSAGKCCNKRCDHRLQISHGKASQEFFMVSVQAVGKIFLSVKHAVFSGQHIADHVFDIERQPGGPRCDQIDERIDHAVTLFLVASQKLFAQRTDLLQHHGTNVVVRHWWQSLREKRNRTERVHRFGQPRFGAPRTDPQNIGRTDVQRNFLGEFFVVPRDLIQTVEEDHDAPPGFHAAQAIADAFGRVGPGVFAFDGNTGTGCRQSFLEECRQRFARTPCLVRGAEAVSKHSGVVARFSVEEFGVRLGDEKRFACAGRATDPEDTLVVLVHRRDDRRDFAIAPDSLCGVFAHLRREVRHAEIRTARPVELEKGFECLETRRTGLRLGDALGTDRRVGQTDTFTTCVDLSQILTACF